MKILIILSVFLLLPALLFATDEQLTITTYYPSPYGVYNELRTNGLKVGLPANTTVLTDGVAKFATLTNTNPNGGEGGIYYYKATSATTGNFRYHNGSTWVNLTGGGTSGNCIRRRSATLNLTDGIQFCDATYPNMISCSIVDDNAPNLTGSTMGTSAPCTTNGACDMSTTRLWLGQDMMYLESVVNNSGVQGCLAYDRNHNHMFYKIEVTCCR